MSYERAMPLLAALVLAAVTVSSCTSDAPTPKPLATSSSTASPAPTALSPATTVTAPTMPAEARGPSRSSADAFVGHWIDVLDYSGPAGQTDELRRISASQCQDCNTIATLIESVARKHGRIAGDGWRLLSVRPGASDRPGFTVVDATVQVRPQTLVTRRGASPKRFAGGVRHKEFWLTHSARGWRLVHLYQVGD